MVQQALKQILGLKRSTKMNINADWTQEHVLCEQPLRSRIIMEHKLTESSKAQVLVEPSFNLSKWAVALCSGIWPKGALRIC